MAITTWLLVSCPGNLPEEVAVTFDRSHRVADLITAVARFLGVPSDVELTLSDGSIADRAENIVDSSIRSGDHLVLAGRQAARSQPLGRLELRVVGGASNGARLPLPDGRHSLGRSADCTLRLLDPTVSRAPAWLSVRGEEVTIDEIDARQTIRIRGQTVVAPAPVGIGEVFEMGGALLTVAPALNGLRGPASTGEHQTSRARQPRTIELPPTPPGSALGAADPRRHRRLERYRADAAAALAQLPAVVADEEAARRVEAPDACDLAERVAHHLPTVWERGPDHPDFLRLRFGWGELPSLTRVQPPTDGDGALVSEVLSELMPRPPLLSGVPLTVDLSRTQALAVTGPPEVRNGLLRWLVAQAAVLHAPSDLVIAALVGEEEPWGWLKWLPHTALAGDLASRRLVGSGPDIAVVAEDLCAVIEERRALSGDAQSTMSRPRLLLLVEEGAPDTARLLDLAGQSADIGVHALLFGSGERTNAADARLDVSSVTVNLRGADSSGRLSGVPDQLGMILAAQVARDLAVRADTPGRTDAGARIPATREFLANWGIESGSLDVEVGQGDAGPVVVDLRSGPHTLVVGSPETCRSELIANLVTGLAVRHSPRWLRLLLVTPGDAPAFRVLRGFPHAATFRGRGAGPSVDEALAVVGSEIESRSRLVEAGGVAAMAELLAKQPDRVPAHLVVVIDGLDSLVGGHPEFQDRLAALADAGQGLGVHLVLGMRSDPEQFPAGLRRHARLRIATGVDGGDTKLHSRTAKVSTGEGPGARFQVQSLQRTASSGDPAVAVERLAFAGPATGVAPGQPPLAAVVLGANQAAQSLDPTATAGGGAAPAPHVTPRAAKPRAPRAAPVTARKRQALELRLTVEVPRGKSEDVSVELDREDTVAALVTALGAELGLEVARQNGAMVYLSRRQAWLRPDQSIGSARLKVGDRVVIATRDWQDAEVPPPGEISADLDSRVDDHGRISFNRPPRPTGSAPNLAVPMEAPPERGQVSMRALIPVGTSVGMGVVMGAVSASTGRPGIALISAAITPVMAILTGFVPVKDIITRRRAFRRGSRDFRSRLKFVGSQMAGLQAAESSHLHESAPEVAALVERVSTLDPALWERGPSDPDWLHLRIGLQRVAATATVVVAPGGDEELRKEAEAEINSHRATLEVPMVLPIAEVGALGIHGDRFATTALVRWLAVQAAVLHSPEELVIAAALPASERPDWSWLGWLPHVHSDQAALPEPRVVAGAAASRSLLQRLLVVLEERAVSAGSGARSLDREPAAVLAILHEDSELPRAQVARLLGQGPRFGIFVIWMAARREELPGQCQAEVGLTIIGDTVVPELRRAGAGRPMRGTQADGLSNASALEVARGLAPLRDAGGGGAQAAVPETVNLLDALRFGRRLDAEVYRSWTSPRPSGARQLGVTLGMGAGGSGFAVELHIDGPHLLVTGPPTSGKSELLRTFVASLAATHPPDVVSFLLFDPGDQGTFRECAQLPHTASVVTFLDASGAKRVLGALQAEVKGREKVVREAGVRDLSTLEQSHPELAPPSLVIVVDDGDRLTKDLAEFVDGLVDVARQGSRLGIHLVTAFRRIAAVPEGIRDGANLRLSLRVSDDQASRGGHGRANVPPGRVFASAGLDAATREMQTAYVSGHSLPAADEIPVSVRELDFSGIPVLAPLRASPSLATGDPDLARLIGAIDAVASGAAIDLFADDDEDGAAGASWASADGASEGGVRRWIPRGSVDDGGGAAGTGGWAGAAALEEAAGNGEAGGGPGRRRFRGAVNVLAELREEGGESAGGSLVGSVALTDLLHIADIGSLDVQGLWQLRPLAERLRVPIGLDSIGQPMMVDLKEAAAGGSGPHGLLIGTSGSGKSEALRTLVASLAINHPPEVLAFVFIDFKGGAAFAELSELPHAAGMITNLGDDLSLIDRMQAAITGERNRRQEMLRRAGNVDKVSEYQRLREGGAPLDPLPYLLIIVDEFGELLSARPDFIDLFAMIGRVGRSLGMHLLFSSQQFEEGRLRGLEDNLGYRIALRTASAQASKTVLGVPDAFELPKEPGWGYFKSGPSDVTRFRAAVISQPYVAPGAAPSPPAAGDAGAATNVGVAVSQMRAGAEAVHRIWLDPLQVGITLDGVLGPVAATEDRGLAATAWGAAGQLQVPIGRVDKPMEQKQDVMAADLTGHLLIVGASQTGKSTLLRTLVASAALTHTPREAQFYCLDFSGGALRSAAGLPHVGGVAGREDPERVRRTVEEVVALVARREVRFQELGIDSAQVMRARRAGDTSLDELADVFLVVDNWMGLRQDFAELEDLIRDVVVARGPGYGVHLIMTANRSMEVRDALRNAMGGRLELRLTEPSETLMEPRAAAKSLRDAAEQFERRMKETRERDGLNPVFDKLYGRGIMAGGLHFQTALPRIDGTAEVIDLHAGFESLVTRCRDASVGSATPPIRVLPRNVTIDELRPRRGAEPAGVPLGISELDLDTFYLDLVGGDPHFVVIGDVESGKSTCLRTFLSGLAARSTPDSAQVLLVDYKRSLLGLVPPEMLLNHCSSEELAKERVAAVAESLKRRLPGPEVSIDEMESRSWWKSPAEVYVVVDDYDLVASSSGGPLQPLYALLPQSRHLAFHLVVARSAGGAGMGMSEPVMRRLKDLRSPGLLLSGEAGEGTILSGYKLTPLPPGRGRLIRKREPATFLQVAR